MAKTGRPKTYGATNIKVLFEAPSILEAYHQARQQGEKYEAALEAAAAVVKKTSPSKVKKLLRDFMQEDAEEMIMLSEPSMPVQVGVGPPITGKVYALCFKPKVHYPRANRKKT